MKKVVLILLASLGIASASYAAGSADEEILSLLSEKAGEATRTDITTLLGQPAKTETGNKTDVWYYSTNATHLTIYWNNRTSEMEKVYFSKTDTAKTAWDNALGRGLRTGQTTLASAVKMLGIPDDMRIKTMNQELHYSYQHYMLHLFFHKGTLVNYTFY